MLLSLDGAAALNTLSRRCCLQNEQRCNGAAFVNHGAAFAPLAGTAVPLALLGLPEATVVPPGSLFGVVFAGCAAHVAFLEPEEHLR